MYRLVAALAVVVLPTLCGAACAKDTLSLGMVLEPPILDPTAGAAAAIREVTYQNLFQGLTRIDRNGHVQPSLATGWTISPDGLTYTFRLAGHVRFHDGTPFDCSVVRFSFARAMAPDSINAQKQLFDPIKTVSCADDLTAVVTLSHPTAPFLFDLGWGDAVMVAPNTAAQNKTHPIGTGPFRFRQWVQGDRVVLERNPDYWGPKANFSTLTFRFIADPAAAAAALLAGDLDAFSNFPSAEPLDAFKSDPRFVVTVGTTEGKTILALNNARPPFDDIRVRRALAYAIDDKQLIDALGGYGVPIGSHYIPTDPGYVDLTNTYPPDPEKAKALLAESKIAPGTTFTIMLPPPPYARRGGEVIAAMLEQVGLHAKLQPIEWAQWLDQVFKQHNFDATIIAHVEARDLDIYARPDYYFGYQSPAYKDLYRRYTLATQPDEQFALLGDLQRKLATDEPNVYLFSLPKLGVWNAKLQGLWPNDPTPANDVSEAHWSP